MQGTASIKPYIKAHRKPVSIIKTEFQSQPKATASRPKSRKNIFIIPTETSNPQLGTILSQAEPFVPFPLSDASLTSEYMEVNNHLSTVEDPLWKHICQDILEMMGPVSALKIWRSKLEPFSPQDKILPITCENVDTALFVQQYDFVILSSIQKYFPTLKQLKAKVTVAFTRNN